jgi:hypothetical protein
MPDTADAKKPVEIVFRIPGAWSQPLELMKGLPAGFRLTPQALIMPDGTQVEFNPLPPDTQFPEIFRSSCRQPPTEEELATVAGYAVNVVLQGPGGSKEAAHALMRAAAASGRAGAGGGVIDNCALAHGGQFWLDMTEDASPDAISFAFVAIVRGQTEVWTMGMHALGLRDVVMQRADVEYDGFDIVEVIRYLARGDKPIGDGHVIADLDGPCFQAFATESLAGSAASPMHNPFGRLKLVSIKYVAGQN